MRLSETNLWYGWLLEIARALFFLNNFRAPYHWKLPEFFPSQVINNISQTAWDHFGSSGATKTGRIEQHKGRKMTKIKLWHKPDHHLLLSGADRFA